MKPFAFAFCCISTASALSGCTATQENLPAAPPPTVGNGLGSQYGNYGAQAAGEMRGSSGERCVVFNWDRPLSADLVLRYTSTSCESGERPGMMQSREISRTVIPLSQSNLKDHGGAD